MQKDSLRWWIQFLELKKQDTKVQWLIHRHKELHYLFRISFTWSLEKHKRLKSLDSAVLLTFPLPSSIGSACQPTVFICLQRVGIRELRGMPNSFLKSRQIWSKRWSASTMRSCSAKGVEVPTLFSKELCKFLPFVKLWNFLSLKSMYFWRGFGFIHLDFGVVHQ